MSAIITREEQGKLLVESIELFSELQDIYQLPSNIVYNFKKQQGHNIDLLIMVPSKEIAYVPFVYCNKKITLNTWSLR